MRYSNRPFTTASAGDMAEAFSSCADSSDVMLLLDTVLLVSIFVMAVLVRVSILVLIISVILLHQRKNQTRLRTSALIN